MAEANGSSVRAIWRDVLDRHGFGAALLLLILAVLFGWVPAAPVRAMYAHVERDRYRDFILWQLCERLPPQPGTDAGAKQCLKPWKDE